MQGHDGGRRGHRTGRGDPPGTTTPQTRADPVVPTRSPIRDRDAAARDRVAISLRPLDLARDVLARPLGSYEPHPGRVLALAALSPLPQAPDAALAEYMMDIAALRNVHVTVALG